MRPTNVLSPGLFDGAGAAQLLVLEPHERALASVLQHPWATVTRSVYVLGRRNIR